MFGNPLNQEAVDPEGHCKFTACLVPVNGSTGLLYGPALVIYPDIAGGINTGYGGIVIYERSVQSEGNQGRAGTAAESHGLGAAAGLKAAGFIPGSIHIRIRLNGHLDFGWGEYTVSRLDNAFRNREQDGRYEDGDQFA